MANNYTPRRTAPDNPAPRRTSGSYSRDSGSYSRQTRSSREPRYQQREEDLYVRRRPPQKRRRKKGPPVFPIILLLLVVVTAVVIFFVVRGCSAQPEGNTPAGSGSQTSQASSAAGSGVTSEAPADSVSSGGDTQTSSTPEESPTPAPQEEPQAAPETAGSLLIVGDTAYEYYNFNTEIANEYITAVADAGTKLSGIATLYDMIIPTSIDIDLPESYIESNSINTSPQRKAIEEYMYPSITGMNSSVKTVSIYDTLKAHANEYLYFRTDHHWTQLGAYYAYVEFCKVRGFEPVALDQFEKREYAGYLGSFYSSSSTASAALGGNPDTVEAYAPQASVTLNATQKDGTVLENWPLIADGDTYSEPNKYLVFAAGDQPYEEIINNDMADGPSCIVVKESFGNCFVPFLVNHYKTVYVVDYRDYQGTVSQLAQEKGVDDVLCLNNISMTRNQGLVDQFSAIF